MRWTRGLLAALAVCALCGGPAGCGTGDAHGREDGVSASPVGTLLEEADEEGRFYRDVDEKGAPEVGIEIQPDSADSWDVRLTVHNFRFSPTGARTVPVAGRGIARLYVDGRTVARLRSGEYHLAGRLVPRGTHHVTARLYADDGTVWAVHGEAVESTADVTASRAGSTPDPAGSTPDPAGPAPSGAASDTGSSSPPASPDARMSGQGTEVRSEEGGSPDPGGKAS
ncbi:nuclear transport factor 2 family protein [Streptomyces sp. NPDC005244]|uniref:nuclear transport factor 2 family protein n=1 Tax=Streptomyces sp. NPDC005244 TaxID=3364708 RepID=UPI003684A4B5